jgi:hypothetical protein
VRGTKRTSTKAAHRRAVVRRYDLRDWHFMAAKLIRVIGNAQRQPNRRAGGRPGDARRPAALIPRGEIRKRLKPDPHRNLREGPVFHFKPANILKASVARRSTPQAGLSSNV